MALRNNLAIARLMRSAAVSSMEGSIAEGAGLSRHVNTGGFPQCTATPAL